MKAKSTRGRVAISLSVDVVVYEEIHKLCKDMNIDFNDFIVRAIDEHIKRMKRQNTPKI